MVTSEVTGQVAVFADLEPAERDRLSRLVAEITLSIAFVHQYLTDE